MKRAIVIPFATSIELSIHSDPFRDIQYLKLKTFDPAAEYIPEFREGEDIQQNSLLQFALAYVKHYGYEVIR